LSAAVRRSFASLEIRNYRLYFGGQVVSLAGNWMQIVAELWLVLALTGSGVAVGLATALQFAGILLLGAVGGSLADRFDKRKLLIASQTGMAVPAVLLFALTVLGDEFAPRHADWLWRIGSLNCGLSTFDHVTGSGSADPADISGWRCVTWMAPTIGPDLATGTGGVGPGA